MTEILKRDNLDSSSPQSFYKPGLNIYDIAPEDALKMRLNYVNEMGWLDPNRTSDLDVYDKYDKDTAHIVHRDDGGRLVASMRLTPIDYLEESLSFVEMIGSDQDYQDSVRQQFAYHNIADQGDVQLWDLTRLVHDTTREGRGSVLPAFLEMFGAGLAATRSSEVESGNQPWWVFITTGQVKNTLERCGIETHLLGRQSYADNPSYCCLVRPEEAMAKLRANPDTELTYRVVQAGFDKAVGIN